MSKQPCYPCGSNTSSRYNPVGNSEIVRQVRPQRAKSQLPVRIPTPFAKSAVTPTTPAIYHVPGLTENIVYGCNLACPHCFVFAPFQRGYQSDQDIIAFADRMQSKIKVPHRMLAGGEPLLHPRLENIIRRLSRISKINVWTNGTLLYKQPDSFFETIRSTNTGISISPHALGGQAGTLPAVIASLKVLQDNGIVANVRHAGNTVTWDADINPETERTQIQRLSKGHMPQCHIENPIKQHNETVAICPSRHYKPTPVAPTVNRGRIYYCFRISCLNTIAHNKLTPEQIAIRDDRRNFVDDLSTPDEIKQFFDHRYEGRNGCQLCSGVIKPVTGQQVGVRKTYQNETKALFPYTMQPITYEQYLERAEQCGESALKDFVMRQIQEAETLLRRGLRGKKNRIE